MTPQCGELKENGALTALVDLAKSSVQPATPVQLSRGLQEISSRLEGRRHRRRWVFRSSFALATAACLLVGIAVYSRSRPGSIARTALAYQIEGGTVIDGGYLHESGSAGMKLFFAEGTEFILMPGTRGRLRTVDSQGARIAIEQGAASFQVTPRQDARWLVDVGPFLVKVKGTVFAVSWDAAAERFELRLSHGRVAVTGPVSGGEIEMRAGQRLVVDLRKADTLITEQKPEEAWLESPPSATVGGMIPATTSSDVVAPSERPASRPSSGASPATRADADHRWAGAVAAGQWDRILSEVEHAGVKSTLERASSDDLFAIADAARYRRRIGLARAALMAERRRFPGSPRALDATFMLGRVEESTDQGTRKALQWYEEYLARAPSGTYASEALGRKMIVTSRLEGSARAQPIAEDYLHRFPSGTYAGAARALSPSR